MLVQQGVEIGTKLLLRMLFIVAGLYVLYLVKDVVFLVLFAVLTAAAVSPAINRIQRIGVSRTVAVIIAYAVLLAFVALVLSVFLPLFLTEIKEFLKNWPTYTNQANTFLSGLRSYLDPLGSITSNEQPPHGMTGAPDVSGWFSDLLATSVSLFQSFIHLIGFFFLSLYLSLEEKGMEKFFLMLTPKEYHATAISIASRMQGKVSQWLYGQALLMLLAFGMYYVGLLILGVPYALAIAFFGGLMEILPYIGPVLAAIPAVLVGLLVSPSLGIAATAFYIIAHQVEAHIIAPQVMKRSASLNPVVFIIAVLAGSELGGPLGIILSVPVTMILSVFVEDILVKRSVE
jgi:predicted PurR-regulated permease PerM